MVDSQLQLVLDHIACTIGLDQEEWEPRPPGYRGQIEAALLDSVFSLRAVYGTSSSKGPRAVVRRWEDHVKRPLDNLEELVNEVDRLGGEGGFRRVLKHDGVAIPNAADQPTKAFAVYTSAKALVDFGVITAADAIRERHDQPKKLLRAIQKGRGVGPQAATYFLMNLGQPGVKADVMIIGFVNAALGTTVSAQEAADLVTSAAVQLKADVIRLDHTIWKNGSDRARMSKRRRAELN